LLYLTINLEQSAVVPQFYGKLKHRKNIKNLDDLKKYFTKRDVYEYKNAYQLAKCNLDQLFKAKYKDEKTGEIKPLTNEEEMKNFFSALKMVGERISKFDNMADLSDYISRNALKLDDSDIISDVELKSTIKKYNKYFNKVGEIMIKKLDKTYPLLIDYYKDKFEKEKINESYYEDLTPHTYSHDRGYKNVVNIGWLDKGEPFEKGDVPAGFSSRLSDLEVVHRHKGYHNCPFCDGGSGDKVLAVKGKGKVYFCPSMIQHYVTKHHYKPPQEFIDAVMARPEKKKEDNIRRPLAVRRFK